MPKDEDVEKITKRTPPINIMAEFGCVIITLAFIILAVVWFVFPFVSGEW